MKFTILAATAFAALSIATAGTASADADDLTNVDVAGGTERAGTVDPTVAQPWLPDTGGGGKAYWIAVLDPQWKPYTNAEGRIIQRCVTGSCGDDIGTTRVSPLARDIAPVNEQPEPGSAPLP